MKVMLAMQRFKCVRKGGGSKARPGNSNRYIESMRDEQPNPGNPNPHTDAREVPTRKKESLNHHNQGTGGSGPKSGLS